MFEAMELHAADKTTVSVRYYAEREAKKCALIAPAMGVPQGFYQRFAEYLATRGIATLTLDYRGIGDSRVGPLRFDKTLLSDWGMDLQACIDWLRRRHPELPLCWIGHSVGGQLLALTDSVTVDRALLLAAQSGYWRHWSGRSKVKMWMLWYFLIPVVTRVAGSLPASLLGGGESIPPRVARQWADWGRMPGYIADYAKRDPNNGFARFNGQLRAYVFSDDALAPEVAVRSLVSEFEAPGEVTVVKPSDGGVDRIGHFGALRPNVKDTLWAEFSDWLAR